MKKEPFWQKQTSKTGGRWVRACVGMVCAFLVSTGFCSCALASGALDEVSSGEERFYLRVYSAVVFYSLGDEFNKLTDYKVEKVRHDGRVWKIPNKETKCYIGDKLIDPSTPFYFWGKALVRVELDDLFDEYVAVVNSGGGGDSGGGGGGGGSTGGPIDIKWGD